MLDRGQLAGTSFNLTLAHEPRYIDMYLAAAAQVFLEIAESIAKGDVTKRIDGKVSHTMFAKLT